MLGAADELTEAGIYVDAAVSRQMQSVIPEVEQLRDAGRLPEKMVVHLGTNGTLSDESVNAFFTALATVPRVVVLTVRAPGKSWIDGNNAKIVALPAQFPNVSVLYWDGLAGQCQGNCFYDDGIHLRQAGQDYYTALIQSQLEA